MKRRIIYKRGKIKGVSVYKLRVDAEALIFLIAILPLSGMLILEKKEKLTTHFSLS